MSDDELSWGFLLNQSYMTAHDWLSNACRIVDEHFTEEEITQDQRITLICATMNAAVEDFKNATRIKLSALDRLFNMGT